MDILISTFVALLIVLDPIGTAPIFMGLTSGMSLKHRRRMALKGVGLSTMILLVFFFIGDTLLEWMGIGLPAFRIAGGILLLLLAIDMVFARQSGLRSTTDREQEEAEHKLDVSVFPLAFPLIAGPGAITTVLLMASSPVEPIISIGMLVVLLASLLVVLVALISATRIMHLLGETGANVITRLLGMLLAALAVQYILDGILTGFNL